MPSRTAGDREVGLWDMSKVFMKVGSTGFGGGMPMLAIIHAETVEKRHWFTQEEFEEAMLVGQLLPGPTVVDASTYLGYRLRGWAGATVAALTFVLPSFLMMLGLTLIYLSYGAIPAVAGVFRGLAAGVVALILSAVWRMGRPVFADPRLAALGVSAFAALFFLRANIVVIVLAAGLIGIVLFRKPADFPAGRKGPVAR